MTYFQIARISQDFYRRKMNSNSGLVFPFKLSDQSSVERYFNNIKMGYTNLLDLYSSLQIPAIKQWRSFNIRDLPKISPLIVPSIFDLFGNIDVEEVLYETPIVVVSPINIFFIFILGKCLAAV